MFSLWAAFTAVVLMMFIVTLFRLEYDRDALCPLALASAPDTVAFMQQHGQCVKYVPERPVPQP